jgi:hypothetical protein
MRELSEAHRAGHPRAALECVQRPTQLTRGACIARATPPAYLLPGLRVELGRLLEEDRQDLLVDVVADRGERVVQRFRLRFDSPQPVTAPRLGTGAAGVASAEGFDGAAATAGTGRCAFLGSVVRLPPHDRWRRPPPRTRRTREPPASRRRPGQASVVASRSTRPAQPGSRRLSPNPSR